MFGVLHHWLCPKSLNISSHCQTLLIRTFEKVIIRGWKRESRSQFGREENFMCKHDMSSVLILRRSFKFWLFDKEVSISSRMADKDIEQNMFRMYKIFILDSLYIINVYNVGGFLHFVYLPIRTFLFCMIMWTETEISYLLSCMYWFSTNQVGAVFKLVL